MGTIAAILFMAALLLLTFGGIYVAFGPPSKKLIDSFDKHEH